VTISYVELAASTRVRRLALKDQYYFDCDCVRCIGSVHSFAFLFCFMLH